MRKWRKSKETEEEERTAQMCAKERGQQRKRNRSASISHGVVRLLVKASASVLMSGECIRLSYDEVNLF